MRRMKYRKWESAGYEPKAPNLCDCASLTPLNQRVAFVQWWYSKIWQGLIGRNACIKHFDAVSCVQEIKIRGWRGRKDGQNQCADPIDSVENKYSHDLILIPSQLLESELGPMKKTEVEKTKECFVKSRSSRECCYIRENKPVCDAAAKWTWETQTNS